MSCKNGTKSCKKLTLSRGGSPVQQSAKGSGFVKKDVAEIMTDKFIELLEQGIIPWKRPWVGGMLPTSVNTNKPYTGMNSFLLNTVAEFRGYEDNYWLTWNQVKDRGGTVKQEENKNGVPVLYYNWVVEERENENGDKEKIKFPYLRYYTVFNVAQTDGIEFPKHEYPREAEVQEKAEALIDQMQDKPNIEEILGRNKAGYSPVSDTIRIPAIEQFSSTAEYYSTKFHELVHSTGHVGRLNRKEVAERTFFGDDDYSMEELVAEMGASMLCCEAGVETDDSFTNSAAYIQNWLSTFKGDKNMLATAGQRAQKAVNYIKGIKTDYDK